MRTSSLLSVILVHAFCNWMGLPRFWGRLTGGETVIGPDIGEGKREDENTKVPNDGQLSVLWTIVYYVLLVAGAVGWQSMLWTLTESESSLATF